MSPQRSRTFIQQVIVLYLVSSFENVVVREQQKHLGVEGLALFKGYSC